MIVAPTRPDLTVVIDLPASEGLARAQARRNASEPAPAEGLHHALRTPTRPATLPSTNACARASSPSPRPNRSAASSWTGGLRSEVGPGQAEARRRPDAGESVMARAPALQQVEELPEADRLEGFHPRHARAVRPRGHRGNARGCVRRRAPIMPGSSPARRGSARPRSPTASPATCWRSSPSAAETVARSRLARRPAPAAKCARCPTRGSWCCAAPTTSRPSASPSRSRSTRCAGSGRSSPCGPRSAWRVVIVDRADEFNVAAANALLKSLEEPPARTLFLLVSSAPGGLLPTIRSRCRTLALAPLASAPLRRAVCRRSPRAAARSRKPPNGPRSSGWRRAARARARAPGLRRAGAQRTPARPPGRTAGRRLDQVHGLAEERPVRGRAAPRALLRAAARASRPASCAPRRPARATPRR